ncbi:aldo/keto reductase [Pelagicoccus sp. NFK12]|uniref:Aldo/keto reductase n=1 Tax=Pelagicoccus enzymogenes TaxID=2773457 RepID=A0A927IHE4_9BACT|nr:aldo/keto reductase [Pelagicoccus enzymogenes]MBD5779744.1 aldo/keto reductase [Pelagicoccus enzymogenes]MDQ8200242.1 aldo/keto reductase [Pelagicoccus enzymogenes]
MKTVKLGNSSLHSTPLVYGCMRISGDNSSDARKRGKEAILAAYEAGYNHFDHADIYGGGLCEELFAEAMKDLAITRESILLTSKCGIRFKDTPSPGLPARYDFTKSYILECVEGSLKRLNTDYLDLFLLHRPDYLFDPDETADALQELVSSGKVRHCGVSNFKPSQLSLLQSRCELPLIVNQVEINIHNVDALMDGTLDQCQERGITPQAWCPIGGVAYPAWGNTFTPEDEARIEAEFDRQAEKYGVENWIVMLAWILRHPSGIVPIVGSTTPERIRAARQSLEINYEREDWYQLLEARNGEPVP